MAKLKFVRPDEAGYVRVRDLYPESEPGSEIMRAKLPAAELDGQEVRAYFPGSDDELQMFEVRCDPDLTFHPHAHIEDEIIYVLDGVIIIGRHSYEAGSAVYVPARTLYAFRSGSAGLRFLNFRPRADTTFVTPAELLAIKRAETGAVVTGTVVEVE